MTINQARGLRASDRDRVACICSRNTDASRKKSGIIDVSVLATASRTRFRPDGPELDDVSFQIVIPPWVAESMILPNACHFSGSCSSSSFDAGRFSSAAWTGRPWRNDLTRRPLPGIERDSIVESHLVAKHVRQRHDLNAVRQPFQRPMHGAKEQNAHLVPSQGRVDPARDEAIPLIQQVPELRGAGVFRLTGV